MPITLPENLEKLLDRIKPGKIYPAIASVMLEEYASSPEFRAMPEKLKKFHLHREVILNSPYWNPEEDYNLYALTDILAQNWNIKDNDEEYRILENAWSIAKRHYEGKKRKEEKFTEWHSAFPREKFHYIKHPYEVALLTSYLGYTPKIAAAALLHDVLEKNPDKKEELLKVIADACSAETALMVEALTDDKEHESVPKFISKEIFAESVAADALKEGFHIFAIKSADRYVNLLTVHEIRDERSQMRQLAETKTHYFPVYSCVDSELGAAVDSILAKYYEKMPELRFKRAFSYNYLDTLERYAALKNNMAALDFIGAKKAEMVLPDIDALAERIMLALPQKEFPNLAADRIRGLAGFYAEMERHDQETDIMIEYFRHPSAAKVDRPCKAFGYEPPDHLSLGRSPTNNYIGFFTKDGTLLEENVPCKQIKADSKGTEDILHELSTDSYTSGFMFISYPELHATRVIIDLAEGPIHKWRLECKKDPTFPEECIDYLEAMDPVLVHLYKTRIEGRTHEKKRQQEFYDGFFSEVSRRIGRTVTENEEPFQTFCSWFQEEHSEVLYPKGRITVLEMAGGSIQRSYLYTVERNYVTGDYIGEFKVNNSTYWEKRMKPSSYFRLHPLCEFPDHPFVVVDIDHR